MSGLGVFSGDRRSMEVMLPKQRSHLEGLAIVCQNGAAAVEERRTSLRNPSKTRKGGLSEWLMLVLW